MMALPPKYVRFVVVDNNYSADADQIHVTGTYQSGHTETLALSCNQSARIEHEHDQGSYTTVDAVTNVTVTSPDGAVLASQDFSSDGGVKAFSMIICRNEDGNLHVVICDHE